MSLEDQLKELIPLIKKGNENQTLILGKMATTPPRRGDGGTTQTDLEKLLSDTEDASKKSNENS